MTKILMLPFMVAIAFACHALLSRGAKAVASASSPLASGEPETAGYERSVYGTADRAMLEILLAVLATGLVWWVAMAWSIGWLGFIGFLMLLGATAFDLSRWERAAVSPNNVWFQRGLWNKVHQVAMANIADVAVSESDARGFTLRHGQRNRVCRLSLVLVDQRVLSLPKTDADTQLEAVETLANHIRRRLRLAEDKEAVKRSSAEGSQVAAEVAAQPPSRDAEMLRELRRLRQRAQAPDLPPAVKPSGPA